VYNIFKYTVFCRDGEARVENNKCKIKKTIEKLGQHSGADKQTGVFPQYKQK
jgi:hypothetical protein